MVEGLLIVEMNEVLAALVGADSQSLLWEGGVLFDAPDLEDPVGVESVDAAARLIADQVDDVVVLEGRPRAQVD